MKINEARSMAACCCFIGAAAVIISGQATGWGWLIFAGVIILP